MNAAREQKISPRELRDEGIFEIGRVGSILFVDTEERLCLFHAKQPPSREIDEYALSLVVFRLESGTPFKRISSDLGISEHALYAKLKRAGYIRMSSETNRPRGHGGGRKKA